MEDIFETIWRFSFNKDNSPAIYDGERLVNWYELVNLTDRVCLGLSRQGLRAGKGVLVLLDKSWHLPIIMLAIIKGRGVFVPADGAFGFSNILEIANRSKPNIIIHDNKHEKIVRMLKEKASYRAIINIENNAKDYSGSWQSITSTDAQGANFPEAKLHMPAYHHYVIDSFGKLQCYIATMKNLILSAYSAKTMFGFKENDKHLSFMPAGFRTFDIILRPLLSGGSIVMSPGNNIRNIAEAIEQYGVTIMQSPPYFWKLLCQWAEICKNDFSSLRVLESCGKTSRYIEKKVKKTIGKDLLITRSIGETLGSYLGPKRDRLSGGIKLNQPFPGIIEKISAKNDLVPAYDQPGELCIKGNIIAIGRIFSDGKKEINLDNEKWLHTKHMARRTMAGDLELLGDNSNIIQKNGQTVCFSEIENCLERHSKVVEAAVIKIPESKEFVAFAKIEENSEVTKGELIKHLKHRLAVLLMPKDIIQVSHFQRFPTGQINRRKLAKDYESENKKQTGK